MPRLGVNIDHVATLRQTRGGREPDPVWAAVLAELGGADVITVHLREDRRHIQDRDCRLLRETVQVRLNLELALEPGDCFTGARDQAPSGDFGSRAPRRVHDRRRARRRRPEARVAVALARCRTRVSTSHFSSIPTSSRSKPRSSWARLRSSFTPAGMPTPLRGRSRPRARLLKVAAGRAVAAGLELHAGHGLNYQNVGAGRQPPQNGRAQHRPQHRQPRRLRRPETSCVRDENMHRIGRFESDCEPRMSRCPRHDQATFAWPPS